MRKFVFILIILIVMPVCASNITTGYIGAFDGSPSAFMLKRNGQELKVERKKPLYAGDKISVLKPKHYITLVLISNKKITLSYENTKDKAYQIKSEQNYSYNKGLWNNISRFINKWWQQLWEDDEVIVDYSSR
jgi:hypothetical protein